MDGSLVNRIVALEFDHLIFKIRRWAFARNASVLCMPVLTGHSLEFAATKKI